MVIDDDIRKEVRLNYKCELRKINISLNYFIINTILIIYRDFIRMILVFINHY